MCTTTAKAEGCFSSSGQYGCDFSTIDPQYDNSQVFTYLDACDFSDRVHP